MLFEKSQNLYYFRDFPARGGYDPNELVSQAVQQHVFRKISNEVLPQGPCRWIFFGPEHPKIPEIGSGLCWAYVSSPVFNPLAKRGRQVGVFILLARPTTGPSRLENLRGWIPLRKRGKEWVALTPDQSELTEF
jgi:hypothetical protein